MKLNYCDNGTQEDFAKVHDGEGSEEGEIVDSDEMICAEDEQNMRQRIKELEAKNDELEKIASISSDFTNRYRYPTDYPLYRNKILHSNAKQTLMSQKDVARIPSDASSISSDEMEPIRKRTKRKGRHSKKDHCKKCRSRSNSLHKHSHRSHRSENKIHKSEEYCRRHNKLRSQRMSSPIVFNENYLETISLDSDEDSDRHKGNSSNSDREIKHTSLHLNRDELRFALARDRTKEAKTTGNLLRERLYNGNVLLDHKENINSCELVTESLDAIKSESKSHASEQSLENSDKDECATQEEQELRLIALKSAILRKHLARKKRNAEMAYSPTDFAPVNANPVIADDNMDVVEEELDELNDVMEISPINSPKLILSPSNDDELSQSELKATGDNNSIDMDIAQSGSEEEIDQSTKNEQWYPIETAPMTAQSAMESEEVLKYPLPVHYGIYVPEMQYQLPPPSTINSNSEYIESEELPPPPPGTEMYPNFAFNEEPPPPPSMSYIISDDDDDDDEPPSHSNVLDTFSNMIADMNFDEEPPPPPPFFGEHENDSTKTEIFERLGNKTEESTKDLPLNEIRSSFSNQNTPNISDDENKDSDEEVSALRAVLLSKLQAAKGQKKEYAVKAKVSEQMLPNVEIVCHSDEQTEIDTENGVETVLQKALRRLKSSFTSTSSSSKENDTRAVRVKQDCLNTLSLVEDPTTTTDAEEPETLSTKSLPHTEKKIGSSRSRIMKKIKKSSSKQSASIDKCNNDINKPAMSNTNAELSDTQAKEKDISPDTISESHESTIPPYEVEALPSSTEGTSERDENKIGSTTVCSDINEDTITNSPTETAETQEIPLQEKQKPLSLPTPKSTALNENSKSKESNLKAKKLNSVTTTNVPARAQPLSAKNNLIPTGISSLKSAQNFLQSTLNKVRTTRTTKIVRPNKVINKEITTNIKRAMTPAGSPTPPAKIQRTTLNSNPKSANSTINVTDVPPKITVKKLVISLRASDTETSDDELMKEVQVPRIDNPIDRVKNTYSEISSPLELLMNSGSCSPSRSKGSMVNENSNSLESQPAITTPATNAAFEQKLDAFLKGIRKKGSLESSSSPNASPMKKIDNGKNFNTPTAVRHLPLASQDEYRRLVHRMKLLEKQKQTKKPDEDVVTATTASKSIPIEKNDATRTVDKIVEEKAASIVKRNVQLKTLNSYENSFEQTSDNIVKLLNKSLSLVAEAKKVKIAKLRHEQRLQELQAEVARVQALFEQEERKFSNMKPHIGASNQFLTTLKRKRRTLMESANKLGKSLKGEKYRINNKMGEEIIAKSRKLHAEIKFVNSLKTENIEAVVSQTKSVKDSSDKSTNSETVVPEMNNEKVMDAKQCSPIVAPSITENVVTVAQKRDENQPALEAQSSVIQTETIKQLGDQIEKATEEIAVDKIMENLPSEPADIVESEIRVELEVRVQLAV